MSMQVPRADLSYACAHGITTAHHGHGMKTRIAGLLVFYTTKHKPLPAHDKIPLLAALVVDAPRPGIH